MSKRHENNPPRAINQAALARYQWGDLTAIPLHKWNAKSTDKGGNIREDGKRPADSAWTTREYDSAKVIADCVAEGRNIGVRLPASVVVVDVDPRHGGDQGFQNLCDDLLIDPEEFKDSTVITGSGGRHIYLSNPQGDAVRDTLAHESDTKTESHYAGVEFKSKGRQVVAAGSRHPNGKLYKWATDASAPLTLPPIPTGLLEKIRRPVSDAVTNGGQISAEELGTLLEENLDPTDYDTNEKWEPLLMASHHSTGGQGRQEFIDWSTSDPKYADNADLIGRRWDSCDDKKEGARTYKTLNRYLREAGKSDAQIRRDDAASDFEELDEADREQAEALHNAKVEIFGDDADPIPTDDDDSWMEGPGESALQELSATYCTVMDGGNFRVMYLEELHGMPGRRYWKSIPTKAFCEHFSNRRIQRDTEGLGKGAAETIQLGKAWIEWPQRPSAIGIAFDATVSPAENLQARIIGGRLNLWTGWGCEAKEGSCERIKQMIRDDLCAGSEEVYRYVLKWIAYKIQKPTEPCFTSIVFRGVKGAGKTTLGGEIMVPIFGSHGMVVSRRDQFVGQFSGHLASLCFIYADEAVWGGNKEDEGVLKQLITDRHRLYRAMYTEAQYGVNRVGLMMGTNEDWAAPAGFDERRFMVQDVSREHVVPHDAKADHPNRIYWDEIRRELNHGGREAFLYEMRSMKLGDWTPAIGVPRTSALAAQIEEGLRGIDRWYYEMLTEGVLPGKPGEDVIEWDKAQLIPFGVLLQSCRSWMREHKERVNVTSRALGDKLKPFGWKRERVNTARGLIAPTYAEAVKHMEKRLGQKLAE